MGLIEITYNFLCWVKVNSCLRLGWWVLSWVQRSAEKFFCFAKHHPGSARQKYTQPGKRDLADLCSLAWPWSTVSWSWTLWLPKYRESGLLDSSLLLTLCNYNQNQCQIVLLYRRTADSWRKRHRHRLYCRRRFSPLSLALSFSAYPLMLICKLLHALRRRRRLQQLSWPRCTCTARQSAFNSAPRRLSSQRAKEVWSVKSWRWAMVL